MKIALSFLGIFCLIIGSVLSLSETNEFYSWFILGWGLASFVVFNGFAATYPER